jgi:uncharacterized protein YacL (UPF0231 family)
MENQAKVFQVSSLSEYEILISENIEKAKLFLKENNYDYESIDQLDENLEVYDQEFDVKLQLSEIEDLSNLETRWSTLISSNHSYLQ